MQACCRTWVASIDNRPRLTLYLMPFDDWQPVGIRSRICWNPSACCSSTQRQKSSGSCCEYVCGWTKRPEDYVADLNVVERTASAVATKFSGDKA